MKTSIAEIFATLRLLSTENTVPSHEQSVEKIELMARPVKLSYSSKKGNFHILLLSIPGQEKWVSAIYCAKNPPQCDFKAPTYRFFGNYQNNPKNPNETQFKIDRYEIAPTLGDHHFKTLIKAKPRSLHPSKKRHHKKTDQK